MKFSLKSAALPAIATPCLIVGVFEKGTLSGHATLLDEAAGGAIGRIVKQGDIDGKAGQHLLLHGLEGIKAARVLLVGCGKREEMDAKKYAAALKSAAAALDKYRLSDALLALDDVDENTDAARKARLAAQIFTASTYR